jgi:uncharacterized membrane protein YfcA
MRIEQHLRFFYAILSGIIAGGLSGLLGITGSVVILPLLLFFGIFQNYKLAIGTVIFTFDPILSIFALIQYAKENQIDYLIGIALFFSYMVGAYIGSKFNKVLNEKILKYITAFILFILSLYVFYNGYNTRIHT